MKKRNKCYKRLQMHKKNARNFELHHSLFERRYRRTSFFKHEVTSVFIWRDNTPILHEVDTHTVFRSETVFLLKKSR